MAFKGHSDPTPDRKTKRAAFCGSPWLSGSFVEIVFFYCDSTSAAASRKLPTIPIIVVVVVVVMLVNDRAEAEEDKLVFIVDDIISREGGRVNWFTKIPRSCFIGHPRWPECVRDVLVIENEMDIINCNGARWLPQSGVAIICS